MIALIISRDGVAPGVIVVHSTTHAPLLKGDTAMSVMLLEKYTAGLKYYEMDGGKRRHRVVPLGNFDKFMTLGARYFEKASLALSQMPCSDAKSVTINGQNYMLGAV